MVVVAHRFEIEQQRRMPSIRSAAAPNSAPSMQCAVRSRSTRRGERQVGPPGSLLYARSSRKRWILAGEVRRRNTAVSAVLKGVMVIS
jgi:hypothetical protein